MNPIVKAAYIIAGGLVLSTFLYRGIFNVSTDGNGFVAWKVNRFTGAITRCEMDADSCISMPSATVAEVKDKAEHDAELSKAEAYFAEHPEQLPSRQAVASPTTGNQ